jgi:tankyrase
LQPLHNAASYGHLEVCQVLIESGADVNAQDIYLFTPLHEATLKKRFEICKLLVKVMASINRIGLS